MPIDMDRVRQLRDQGQSPKQIARTLGIRPAEAARLVRAASAPTGEGRPAAEVLGCWINANWGMGLTVPEHLGTPPDAADGPGLAAVLVARRHRHSNVSVCGYLVDPHCLGVKNALGPEITDERGLSRFRRKYYSSFDGDPSEISIELAREVVFGAMEYARGLGFEPHPDFTAARGHLGDWTGPGSITFGNDGKPLYVSGPYDDAVSVIRTLERTVGAGNFDYLLGMPPV